MSRISAISPPQLTYGQVTRTHVTRALWCIPLMVFFVHFLCKNLSEKAGDLEKHLNVAKNIFTFG